MRQMTLRIICTLIFVLSNSLVVAQDWIGVGTQVPDIDVYDLSGKAVRLSSLWADKPVLLVTGSLTCPPSRRTLPDTGAILDEYKKRLNVAVLYVIDAHPKGDLSPYSGEEWVTKTNIEEGILIRQPRNQDERISRAVELQELLGLSAPIMVDNMDNIGWESIGNRPNSATLISKDGIVLEHQKWFDNENIRHVIERHLSR